MAKIIRDGVLSITVEQSDNQNYRIRGILGARPFMSKIIKLSGIHNTEMLLDKLTKSLGEFKPISSLHIDEISRYVLEAEEGR